MESPDISPHQRNFLRIARTATAIAFGITGGVLASVKHGLSGLVLQFNFWVIPAIILGAVIGWAYWQFILTRLVKRHSQQTSKRFGLYTILLAIGGLLCFLYPIRYVTRTSISDVVQGVIMAFVVVGAIGLLIWAIARILERQDHDQH